MKSEFSFRRSESTDGSLAFRFTRIEAGADESSAEIQFNIELFGTKERSALPATWITSPERIARLEIRHELDLQEMMGLKDRLDIQSDDVTFLKEIGLGLVGMFAVNSSQMNDTTYALTLDRNLARGRGWAELLSGPTIGPDHLLIASVFARRAIAEDGSRIHGS